MFSAPAGRPASINARPIAIAVPGVSSLGLIVIGHPAASAPNTLRTTFIQGKFHATNAITGPTGSFNTVWVSPGTREGTTRP